MREDKRFEFNTDPQNDMLIGPDGCHYDDEAQAFWFGVFHGCGCGNPEESHAFVIDCLASFDRDKFGWGDDSGVNRVQRLVEANPGIAAEFIAHVLSHYDLTEHGGSIYGAWLTERGKQALEIGPHKDDDL